LILPAAHRVWMFVDLVAESDSFKKTDGMVAVGFRHIPVAERDWHQNIFKTRKLIQ
jgi:hypothetical protein